MPHVLIVDDEPSIGWGFRRLLSREGHTVAVCSSAEEGLQQVRSQRPDAVLLDVRLPGMDGLTAIKQFRELCGAVPIVVMTAFGNLGTAVQALDAGVVEYLPKPFELDDVAALVRRLVRPAAPTAARTPSADPGPDGLVGNSPVMQGVYKQIALAARSDVPVLITGESGTGKELVARAVHRHSGRSRRAFVPLSLPALSPLVVESELFGHVRGAFTGADADRAGVFELAEGGSVLLDEIGDVTPAVQVKLLRTIERKEVQRVGDVRQRPADFRVIAATHRDLPALIRAGEFREDLYFRLSVFEIRLPALRERSADIPLLAEHFLRQYRGADDPIRWLPETLQELQSRPWRGNVRELRNAVEHAAIVCRGREIGPESLPEPLPTGEPGASVGDQLRRLTRDWTRESLALPADAAAAALHERLLEVIEPELLRETLAAHGGNRAAAAERLGIHRATLRQKLKRYGTDDANSRS